jgi:hypothetical protein
LAKHALAHIENQAKLLQLLKKKLQMVLTYPLNSWCYLNVIKVAENTNDNSVHGSLEGLPSIPQAKRHLGILNQAKFSNKCNLHDVGSSHGIW